jgi:uncharacterized protein YndB with AHSA1/START domain
MKSATTVGVTVSHVIPAQPQQVYALITDVTRMGDWSPETIKAEWLDGATHAEVGARFKGTNRLGKAKWSTKPTITEATPGQTFAFKVPGRSGAAWRYDLEATDGGTLVTESVAQSRPSPLPIRLLQRKAGVTDRNAHLRVGMATTLERLAAVAQSN